MSGPIAEAFVEISPDLTGFNRKLAKGMDQAARDTATGAAKAERAVESAFDRASRSADRSLRQIGGAAIFADVGAEAGVAGAQVVGSMETAQLEADRQLRQIGGPTTFADIPIEAGASLATMLGQFSAAQAAADHQLRQIGGADAFAPLVASSSAANASLAAGAATSSSSLGGLATGFGLVAGAAAVGGAALSGFAFKGAADMENVTIAFETMLGSGEAAQVFLDDLKDFAASTPFEFEGLTTAASSLISAGFETEKIIPMMTSIGNATSGMGTGAEGVKRATVALQQMSAAGKITGQDLNQLRDAGIPVFDLLSAATGKSKDEIAAMAQAGKLGKAEMEQLFAALETGKGLERFNGLMEKQSASLGGMLSTLKDNAQFALVDAFAPAIEPMKRSIGQVAEAIGPALGAIAPALGAMSSTLVSLIAPLLEGLGTVLAPVLTGLNHIMDSFGESFYDIISSLPLEALGKSIGGLLAAAAPLVNLLVYLGAHVFEALVAAITPVIDVMATLVPVMVDALLPVFRALGPILETVGKTLGEVLATALASLAPVIPVVADALMAIVDALAPLITPDVVNGLLLLVSPFMFILQAIAPVLPMIAELVGMLAAGLAETLASLLPVITEVAGVITTALGSGLKALMPAVLQLVPPLMDLVKMLADGLGRILPSLVPIFPKLAEAGVKLAEAFLTIVEALLPLLPPLLDLAILLLEKIGVPALLLMATALVKVAEAVAWLADAFSKYLSPVIQAVANWLANMTWDKFTSGLASAGRAILEWFKDLPGKIVGWLGDLGGMIGRLLGDALGAAGDGLGDAGSGLLGWFSDLPAMLVEGLLLFPQLLVDGFFAALEFLVTELPGIAYGLFDWFAQLPGKLLAKAGDLGVAIAGWLVAAIPKVIEGAANLIESLMGEIGKLPERLGSFAWTVLQSALGIGGAIVDGILAGVSGAVDFAKDLAADILSALKKVWNGMVESINKAWNALDIDTPFGTVGLPDNWPSDNLKLARGGVTNGPVRAIVGDNPGGIESIIPHNDPARAVQIATQGGLMDVLARGGARFGSDQSISVGQIVLAPGSTTGNALDVLREVRRRAYLDG